jgi:HNH endonuclease/Homeodomain-like domain-containing protein
MPSLQLDTDKRAEALALRLAGWSYAKIARQLNLSRQRIQQLLSPPRSIRSVVASRANYQCQNCGIQLTTNGHVHHKDSTNGDDWNDIDNLQFFCVSCHRQAHSGEYFIQGQRHLSLENGHSLQIRNLSESASSRFREGAYLRGLSQAQYLERLLELHEGYEERCRS